MIKNSFLSESHHAIFRAFVKLIQRRGNKDRSVLNLFTIFSIIKKGLRSNFSFDRKWRLSKRFKSYSPLEILQQSLDNLKPAFYLRNYIKSGRLYLLPVPVTDKRASFIAINWMRQTALKHNKSNKRFSYLLAREIFAGFYKKGDSFSFLKDYIKKAIDQRPFKRFIRKKKRVVVHSKKNKPIRKKFNWINKLQKNRLRKKIRLNRRKVKHENARDYRHSFLQRLAKRAKRPLGKAKKYRKKK